MTFTCKHFKVPKSPHVHLFGLCEEAGERGENPYREALGQPGIRTGNLLTAEVYATISIYSLASKCSHPERDLILQLQ